MIKLYLIKYIVISVDINLKILNKKSSVTSYYTGFVYCRLNQDCFNISIVILQSTAKW